MRALKTSEAAALLNVSPNTLRAWEQRFGFPRPVRSPGRHRLFTSDEIVALRDALQEGLAISSAVAKARDSRKSDLDRLIGAWASLSAEQADSAVAAELTVRTVEDLVESFLLPGVEATRHSFGDSSAALGFGIAWAAEWLSRARRLAPSPWRPQNIVIADATSSFLDPALPRVKALELCLVRAGFECVSVPVHGIEGIGEALETREPSLIVVAGDAARDNTVDRWIRVVRRTFGLLTVAMFCRGDPQRTNAAGGLALSNEPRRAAAELVAYIPASLRPTAAYTTRSVNA